MRNGLQPLFLWLDFGGCNLTRLILLWRTFFRTYYDWQLTAIVRHLIFWNLLKLLKFVELTSLYRNVVVYCIMHYVQLSTVLCMRCSCRLYYVWGAAVYCIMYAVLLSTVLCMRCSCLLYYVWAFHGYLFDNLISNRSEKYLFGLSWLSVR